jgi:hypothetical protein
MQAISASSVCAAAVGALQASRARGARSALQGRQLRGAASNGSRCRAFFKFGGNKDKSDSGNNDPGELPLEQEDCTSSPHVWPGATSRSAACLPSRSPLCSGLRASHAAGYSLFVKASVLLLLCRPALQHTSKAQSERITWPAMCKTTLCTWACWLQR